MAEYDNTNRGALFPNDRKTPGSRQPDYKGSINIEGVEYWVSGWVKDTARGEIVSMSVEKIFAGVKVVSVNTINRQGKRKRTRTGYGQRKATKRAIVTLSGDSKPIDVFSGA